MELKAFFKSLTAKLFIKSDFYKNTLTINVLILLFIGVSFETTAQKDSLKSEIPIDKTQKKWFENFSIRGYAQIRYNRLLETNENLGCEQCDRSWGKDGGFFIRRTRIIFSGQVSKKVYF